MPRYAVTTNFSEKEIQKIRDKCKQMNITPYKLLREATLEFVEEEVKHDREPETGRENPTNSKRGNPAGPNTETDPLEEFLRVAA